MYEYGFVMPGRPLRQPAQHAEKRGQVVDVQTRCRAAIAAARAVVGEINRVLSAQPACDSDHMPPEVRAAMSRYQAADDRPPPGTPVEYRTGRIVSVH
jgi:hypothetical protein